MAVSFSVRRIFWSSIGVIMTRRTIGTLQNGETICPSIGGVPMNGGGVGKVSRAMSSIVSLHYVSDAKQPQQKDCLVISTADTRRQEPRSPHRSLSRRIFYSNGLPVLHHLSSRPIASISVANKIRFGLARCFSYVHCH